MRQIACCGFAIFILLIDHVSLAHFVSYLPIGLVTFFIRPGEGKGGAAVAGEPGCDVGFEGFCFSDHFVELVPGDGDVGFINEAEKLVVVLAVGVDHPFIRAAVEGGLDLFQIFEDDRFGFMKVFFSQ